MRIAQIASIAERVPARKYGGSERIVSHLTEELVARGHDVTLFASGNSSTSAKLSSVVRLSLREASIKDPYRLNELTFLHFGLAYERQQEFDIIHDHTYSVSLPTANLSMTPVVNTVHSCFHEGNILLYQAMSNVNYVTISKSQIPKDAGINIVGTVYHGLDMKHYPVRRKHDGYLLFVGRMSMEKGVHHAIEAAQALNLPMKIVARVADFELDYFRAYVKPKLTDKRLQLIGEVDERERNKLMCGAMAVLHPVTWPEPFGLTMIESMACGTPVIGFNLGSIPEVIKDGVSGFVVDNVHEMIRAIKKIGRVDRALCRKYVLDTFSTKRMVDGYEAIYRKILAARTRVLRVQRETMQPKLLHRRFIFAADF